MKFQLKTLKFTKPKLKYSCMYTDILRVNMSVIIFTENKI